VGPPDVNVHDWEVCHREIRITLSSGCPDTFDQIVYTFRRFLYTDSLCIHIFFFNGLFCSTVSSSGSMASNDRIIGD
jgi:hypothetical protein